MADIHIHRDHTLGLARARELAARWIGKAESKLELVCNLVEGEDSDTIEFKRSGVSGSFVVAGDHFDLDAKLGFLLGAMRGKIEGEIEKALDSLLASEGQGADYLSNSTRST